MATLRRAFSWILTWGATAAWPLVAVACPNCVDTMAEGASTGQTGGAGSMAGGVGGSMAAGYYYSILFMLAVLFTLTGTLVYVIYRHARNATQLPEPEVN